MPCFMQCVVPAGDIEQAVLLQLRRVFQAPEALAATLRSVEAREAEERDRLAAERDALAAELATVKNAASRLLQTRFDSARPSSEKSWGGWMRSGRISKPGSGTWRRSSSS
jgi:hypothetical protein